jgi:hypothetical protein
LDVAHLDPIGWSVTSVPEPTATHYAEVLAELAKALVLWRLRRAVRTRRRALTRTSLLRKGPGTM